MSSFTEPLLVTPYSSTEWRIERSFIYYIDKENESYIIIPVGFITDFASIPRIFWSILPPFGQYAQAATIHDYLFEGGLIHHGELSAGCTYQEANDIFNEAMKVLKVPKWKRIIMYSAVCMYVKLFK